MATYLEKITSDEFKSLRKEDQIAYYKKAYDAYHPELKPEETSDEYVRKFFTDSFSATNGVDQIDFMKSDEFNSYDPTRKKQYVDMVYDNIYYNGRTRDEFYSTLSENNYYRLPTKEDFEASDSFFNSINPYTAIAAVPSLINAPKEAFRSSTGLYPHQWLIGTGINIVKGIKDGFNQNAKSKSMVNPEAQPIDTMAGAETDGVSITPEFKAPDTPKAITRLVNAVTSEEKVLSDEEKRGKILSIASKDKLDQGDIFFLSSQENLAYASRLLPDAVKKKLEKKLEAGVDEYGKPDSFLDQFIRSATGAGDSETSGLGTVGSFAGEIASPLIAFGGGHVVGGPVGALSATFGQSSLRDLVARKRRGELPEDLQSKSIFEIADYLQKSSEKAFVDTAITGVSFGAGSAAFKNATGSALRKAVVGEAASSGAGTVTELAMTGEVSPEGLALSMIPFAVYATKGAIAKRADIKVKGALESIINRRGELEANASIADTKQVIRANGKDFLSGATSQERDILANAVAMDHYIQTQGMEYKAGTLKEIVDLAQKSKEGADAVVENISRRMGLSPEEILDIQNRLIPRDINTPPKDQGVLTKDIEDSVKGIQKDLGYHDPELIQAVSTIQKFKQRIWNSVIDNVKNTGENGAAMVELIRKTDMETEFIYGQNRKIFNDARRAVRQEAGIANYKKALLIGERMIAGKKGEKLLVGIGKVDQKTIDAASKYASTMRGIIDDLYVLQSSAGVREKNSLIRGHKIKKMDDGTYVIYDRDTVADIDSFGYEKSYLSEDDARRAIAEIKTRPLQYVKDYRPQQIDWARMHKASAKDLRYALEVLNEAAEAQFSPEMMSAVDGGKWDAMSVKERLRIVKALKSSYDVTLAASPNKRHQISRAEKKLPSSILRWDSDIWDGYLRDSAEVYSHAKNYGHNNDVIYGMAVDVAKESAGKFSPVAFKDANLGQMSQGSGIPRSYQHSAAMVDGLRAKMLADMVTGNHQRGDISRGGSLILSLETIFKIALGGQLSNIGQFFAPIMYKNNSLSSWAKAIGSLMKDIAVRDGEDGARAFVARHGLSISMSREELIRSMSQANITGATKTVADTTLKLLGFNALDFTSRAIAVVTGKYYSMDLIDRYVKALNGGNQKKAGRYAEQISGLGVNPESLVVNDGGVFKPNYSTYDIMSMSKQFEIDTNYRNNVYNLPEWRYGTWNIVATQFKTFMYHTTKTMDKWLKSTFNKNSDPVQIAADLSRFVVASQIGGSLVSFVKGILPNLAVEDDNDVVKVMKGNLGIANFVLGNLATVGAMGILEIPISVFKHADPGLGPGISDILSTSKFVSSFPFSGDRVATFHKYLADLSPSMFKGFFNRAAQDRADEIRMMTRERKMDSAFINSLNSSKRTMSRMSTGGMKAFTVPEGELATMLGIKSQKDFLYDMTHTAKQSRQKELRKLKKKAAMDVIDSPF